jgi:lipid-A-disaccharide synthase-like uncharacterized protein
MFVVVWLRLRSAGKAALPLVFLLALLGAVVGWMDFLASFLGGRP